MKNRIVNQILVVGLVAMTSPALAKTHNLIITNVQFPKDEIVQTGDTVIWKNDDLVPHTVTAEDGSFKSPSIDAGKEWSYKVTQKKKTIPYKCEFHPNMHGKLIVK